MALDPVSRAMLEALAATGMKPVQKSTVAEVRSSWKLTLPGFPVRAAAAMHETWETHIPLAGRFLPLRIYTATARSTRWVVYFHGGGWTMGSIEESDWWARRLAAALDANLVSVGYRLAPEHPYPAASEDADTALAWVAARAAGAPVVVVGDSAGGNIAAAVVQRRHRHHAIAGQVLICPVLDADLGRASYLEKANQNFLSTKAMRWFWDRYAPDQDARADAGLSPLRTASPEGLPRTVLLTAEHDVLKDEGAAYAAALRAAGVDVELREFSGQMHDFVVFPVDLPQAGAAMQFIRESLDVPDTRRSRS
ncbi:alpha/beta hydrolase [Variovorax sp. RHLX14]|uniref:alpha/beta hydrolase n=1 Tax=Variovorax sp. RHLX14 TaxID=1259731 RepID=UPI003F474426